MQFIGHLSICRHYYRFGDAQNIRSFIQISLLSSIAIDFLRSIIPIPFTLYLNVPKKPHRLFDAFSLFLPSYIISNTNSAATSIKNNIFN